MDAGSTRLIGWDSCDQVAEVFVTPRMVCSLFPDADGVRVGTHRGLEAGTDLSRMADACDNDLRDSGLRVVRLGGV